MAGLQIGLEGTAELVVAEKDLAIALGSGDVAVLGTPRMVALAEAATVAAVDGALEPGRTSVGTRVDMRHLAPSPVGRAVTARAVLSRLDGKLLAFSVEVHDDGGLVGDGTIERVVVNREKFGR
jgi:predicted thioesterase